MTVTPSDLRAVPLFQDITDEHLEALIGVFETVPLQEGQVLFERGDCPAGLMLLVEGEVSLREGDQTRFRLHPVAPIGELGALTGLCRYTTAVVSKAGEALYVPTSKLMAFFERRGDVAFPFYHNLLRVLADKIRRDERRVSEMRTNIVRTQKAMKRLRDLVLESEVTVLSKPVYETLEDLIEHNRRWHYHVEPAHTLQASVRFDDGSMVDVREMSDGWIKLPKLSGPIEKNSHWSGVLVLPSAEIPISGTIEAISDDGVLIRLDLLIAEYASRLEDYLTRLHMLDFVV